ncbi:MAG TPA: agmatine deiminase family protein [Pirellulales bacterium]|nr:agmatine deiminase family protein [Pirellulales bacterium]
MNSDPRPSPLAPRASPLSPAEVPAALGYRMPAEWEPHAATWLAWPHKRESWPGKFEPIPPLFARLVRTLAQFEPVHILAGGADPESGTPLIDQVKQLLGNVPNVTLHNIPTNDAWTRDHGPTFLVGPPGSPPALVDWGYNAWGGKYPPFDLDDAVPQRIAQYTGRKLFHPGIILEGGAIDSNGLGTILTTEQCLLNPNRNPQLCCHDMEKYLADYLGAKKTLWLGEGIEGDDTDGHIDELARFVGPRTVVAALEDDTNDVNYSPLRENFERLQRMTDQNNQPLNVIALPMPRPIHYEDQRLPASYCNFYLANGVAIVPQFDDPADAKVLQILSQLLPGRQIIGLPARDLVWGLGAFHCITQQEPALN